MTLDITRRLDAGFPAWPGDPVYSRVPEVHDEPYVAVSRLSLGTHTGTHVDAPLHFVPGGAAVDTLSLEVFWGRCLVVDVRQDLGDAADGLITSAHLDAACSRAGGSKEAWRSAERLLLRTDSVLDAKGVPSRTPGVSPILAKTLSGGPLRLLGIDTPSIDPLTDAEADDHPAHRTLLGAGVALLEWLDLSGVPPGPYELSALPLRLAGADGSPVRAALRSLEA